MNESDTTKKDCRLQDENEIESNDNSIMDIYHVTRKDTHVVYDDYSYYGHYNVTDNVHLGYFSTVEKAFEFIKNRVANHYGRFDDYTISLVDLDSHSIPLSDVEQESLSRWNQFNPMIKAGDTDG